MGIISRPSELQAVFRHFCRAWKCCKDVLGSKARGFFGGGGDDNDSATKHEATNC